MNISIINGSFQLRNLFALSCNRDEGVAVAWWEFQAFSAVNIQRTVTPNRYTPSCYLSVRLFLWERFVWTDSCVLSLEMPRVGFGIHSWCASQPDIVSSTLLSSIISIYVDERDDRCVASLLKIGRLSTMVAWVERRGLSAPTEKFWSWVSTSFWALSPRFRPRVENSTIFIALFLFFGFFISGFRIFETSFRAGPMFGHLFFPKQ